MRRPPRSLAAVIVAFGLGLGATAAHALPCPTLACGAVEAPPAAAEAARPVPRGGACEDWGCGTNGTAINGIALQGVRLADLQAEQVRVDLPALD